jgi:hypothetical protein
VKHRYRELDPGESLERFTRERAASLAWLDSLNEVDWDATYAHQSGPLRAGDLLVSWLAHDDLHARQMLHIHHRRSLAIGAPYSAGYAGAW